MFANADHLFRCCPHYDDIAGLERLVPERRPQTPSFANHPNPLEMISVVFPDLTQCLTNQIRVGQHSDLSQIIFETKVSSLVRFALVRRQQKASNQEHK